jgi:hypothetical protein
MLNGEVDYGIRKRGMAVSEHTRRLYLLIDSGEYKLGVRVSRPETRTGTREASLLVKFRAFV